MENFQEFDQPSGPQKNSSDIISHAFEMYKGVFLYALLAMVIYIVASIFVQSLSGFNFGNGIYNGYYWFCEAYGWSGMLAQVAYKKNIYHSKYAFHAHFKRHGDGQ